jgi:hypothetical protein
MPSRVEQIIASRGGRRTRSSVPAEVKEEILTYVKSLKPGARVTASEVAAVLYEMSPAEKAHEAKLKKDGKAYYMPWAKAKSLLATFKVELKRVNGNEGSGEFVRQ